MTSAVRGLAAFNLAVTLLLAVAAARPVGAVLQPVVTVTISGDRVEYDHETRTLAVQGHVTITGSSDTPGLPTVALSAEQLEANLTTGQMVASSGVQLITQQAAIKSDHVEFNFRKDEYTVRQGVVAVTVDSKSHPGEVVRGFFFGDQIARRENLLYVIEGRVTTCDRARPHYQLGAQRLTFDNTTGQLTITKGRLRVHGLNLSIPGRTSLQFGADGAVESSSLKTRIPGYSSYDGLYLPYEAELSAPGAAWQVTGGTRLGTRLRLPFELVARRKRPHDTLTATLSRRRNEVWDFNQLTRVDRLPELSYQYHSLAHKTSLPRLEAVISLGYYREHLAGLPVVDDERLQLGLEYTPRPWQRRARQGLWWAASGKQNFYGDGGRLRDLQLEAGGGRQLGSSSRLALWGVHHFVSGESPFAFDEIYARDELYALGETKLTDQWALRAQGRYDLDTSRLRDYSLRLSQRQHCLTWHLEYNYARSQISIGLDLNGLTGGTAPYASQPLIDPAAMPSLPSVLPGAGELIPGRWQF